MKIASWTKRMVGTTITTIVAVVLFSASAKSIQPTEDDDWSYLASLSIEQLGMLRCVPD